jgi:hypothetical protein
MLLIHNVIVNKYNKYKKNYDLHEIIIKPNIENDLQEIIIDNNINK